MRLSIVLLTAISTVVVYLAQCICTVPALALVSASADTITAKAIQLMTDDKVDDAVKMELEAVKTAPDYWLPHAAMSCMLWRAGVPDGALAESRKALKLAPDNPTVRFNSGVFHHLTGDFAKAAEEYQSVLKVAPDDWEAGLNYVDCLGLLGKTVETGKALDKMASEDHNSFNWWFELGGSYYGQGDYKKAESVLEKALQHATPDQKRQAATGLMLAEMRANNVEKAKPVLQELLQSGSKESFVYRLAAAHLENDPQSASQLLAAAQKNIDKDGWTLFEMSRSFEYKGRAAGVDATSRQKWLAVAKQASDASILVEPRNVVFRYQLLSILDPKNALISANAVSSATAVNSTQKTGEINDLLAVVKNIHDIDTKEPLAILLLKQLSISENDVAAKIKTKVQGDSAQAPYHLKLCRGAFEIPALSCACHLISIESLLQQRPGVVNAHVDKSGVVCPKGFIYFDPAVTTLNEVLRCTSKLQESAKALGTTPVNSLHEIIDEAMTVLPKMAEPEVWTYHSGEPRLPLVSQESNQGGNK